MLGTIVNVIAVLAGGSLGLLLNKRLPQRFVRIFFQVIGLFTLFLGISMALDTTHVMHMIVALISGSLIGELLRLASLFDRMGEYLKHKLKFKDERFYPPGQNGDNKAMAQTISKSLQTKVNSGTTIRILTNPPNYDLGETDNARGNIRKFLDWCKAGCESDTGYTVNYFGTHFRTPGARYIPTSSDVTWEIYDREIRNGQAVILSLQLSLVVWAECWLIWSQPLCSVR